MPTIQEQIAELEREIATRKRVFPSWVSSHKLPQEVADHRIACLEATLQILQSVTIGRDTLHRDDLVPPQPKPKIFSGNPLAKYDEIEAREEALVHLHKANEILQQYEGVGA